MKACGGVGGRAGKEPPVGQEPSLAAAVYFSTLGRNENPYYLDTSKLALTPRPNNWVRGAGSTLICALKSTCTKSQHPAQAQTEAFRESGTAQNEELPCITSQGGFSHLRGRPCRSPLPPREITPMLSRSTALRIHQSVDPRGDGSVSSWV